MRKHHISARQIKAARALIDWSQDDLAVESGLSVATIRKLESGHISPRSSTTDNLRDAFESKGLEFIEPGGVRQQPKEIKIYEGYEGVVEFFDDVYQVASSKGGEFICVCKSEKYFTELLEGHNHTYLEKMAKIADRFSFRCILTEDAIDSDLAEAYCDFRMLSKHYVDSVPFYVYDNNYAIFLFEAQLEPKIIIVQSQEAANAYRRQFASMWDKATPLNKTNQK